MIPTELEEARYCGYVDMPTTNIKTLNSITYDGTNLHLAGDKVELIPAYKHIKLQIGNWELKGSTKAELCLHIVDKYESSLIGEYEGWKRYLVQYKQYTLVIAISVKMYASIKFLADDKLAKELYEIKYNTPINEWRKVEMTSKVYGDIAVGLPHVLDDIIERAEVALEFLESTMNDSELREYITERLERLLM